MVTGPRDVIWAPSVYADLDQALAQREDAPVLLEAVLEAAESLATLSNRGRLVPELDDAIAAATLILNELIVVGAGSAACELVPPESHSTTPISTRRSRLRVTSPRR